MNKELLKEATSVLNIQDVVLRDFKIHIKDNYDPVLPIDDGQFVVQFRHGVIKSTLTIDDEDETVPTIFRTIYECAFRFVPKDLGEDDYNDSEKLEEVSCLEVVARFSAYYNMNEKVSEDALNEFSKFNVGYHVWPYWREHVSSLIGKMHLPSFSVPLYKIN